MQKFSLHTHTNSLGIFDGQHSIEEMIEQAEKVGLEEIGISNHFCYHPNAECLIPILFNDYQTMQKAISTNVDMIHRAADKSNIKVYAGLEVDFFPSNQWRTDFEKLLKTVDVDYLIGSFHFLRNKDESKVWNMYCYKQCTPAPSIEEQRQCLDNYWDNVVMEIESGYFDFIAHPDVYQNFPALKDLIDPTEGQWKVIEALDKHKHPYELNTSGWPKRGMQNPATWMLKELAQRNVPIVISDDAHHRDRIGEGFERAEQLLADLNYTSRWQLHKSPANPDNAAM